MLPRPIARPEELICWPDLEVGTRPWHRL